MATADDYAQGLLDKDPTKAEASTYDAEKRDVNRETDTVQGQLDSVLNSDSKYIKRARTSAKQYSQSRGLLNSSIAAQAGESAAIDAAMPIAQQDADTNFRQGLENQAAENTARSTNAQLETNVSTANAANDASSRNQALQTKGALEQERMKNATAISVQGMQDAAALERTQLTEEGQTHRTAMENEAAIFRTNLSEMAQTDRQRIIAQTDIQTNNARVKAEKLMNDKKVASQDRESFSQAFNEMSRQNYVEITKTATDSELSASEKSKLIAAQNDRYTSDATLLSDLYQVPLDVSPSDDAAQFFADQAAAEAKAKADEEAAAKAAAKAAASKAAKRAEWQRTHGSHSCFTGDCTTYDAFGKLIRVDSVRPGDELMGANGKFNTVIGIEKVPVAGRDLWKLDGVAARFTGEHPFLMADGSWGAFNKEAMDRELTEDNITIVETNEGMFRVIGDMQNYDEKTVRQISNGDLGQTVDGKEIELSARIIKDKEEFVYTMFMDGNRTWNIEGIVISGLALTGENANLIELEAVA